MGSVVYACKGRGSTWWRPVPTDCAGIVGIYCRTDCKNCEVTTSSWHAGNRNRSKNYWLHSFVRGLCQHCHHSSVSKCIIKSPWVIWNINNGTTFKYFLNWFCCITYCYLLLIKLTSHEVIRHNHIFFLNSCNFCWCMKPLWVFLIIIQFCLMNQVYKYHS